MTKAGRSRSHRGSTTHNPQTLMATTPTPTPAAATSIDTVQPAYIFDMGRQKKKVIKKLKKGGGPIDEHVDEAIAHTKTVLGDAGGVRVFVPIVLVYEKKKKKKSAMPMLFPGAS